jgi:hypothetical protein
MSVKERLRYASANARGMRVVKRVVLSFLYLMAFVVSIRCAVTVLMVDIGPSNPMTERVCLVVGSGALATLFAVFGVACLATCIASLWSYVKRKDKGE